MFSMPKDLSTNLKHFQISDIYNTLTLGRFYTQFRVFLQDFQTVQTILYCIGYYNSKVSHFSVTKEHHPSWMIHGIDKFQLLRIE